MPAAITLRDVKASHLDEYLLEKTGFSPNMNIKLTIEPDIPQNQRLSPAEAVRKIREFRKKENLSLGGESIKDLIQEGRK